MLSAHGGTPGLIAETAPLVLLVIGGLVVWIRSRKEGSDLPGAGDEPPVQEADGDGERGGGRGLSEPEQGASGSGDGDPGENERVPEGTAP